MNRQRALLILVVVVLAGAVGWFWIAHRSAPPAPVAEAAPNVDTATARIASIDVTVQAVGHLGAGSGSQAKLGFVSGGRIGALYVRVGDRVTAGQSLASLDASSLVLAQNQAGADVRAAQAQAEAAAVDRTSTKIALDRRALQREIDLYNAGVAARKDIEAARAQLAADSADMQSNAANAAAARAQVQSARAKAASAQHDVANATLAAPQDGVVAAIYHTVGETVDPTTAVIAVSASATSSATLMVDANDASRIHPGDRVRMKTQGGLEIPGLVAGVAASVDPVTQQAEVRVDAAVPTSLAGSAISAVIVVGTSRGVVIPHDAIVIDPATGAALAFVLGKNKDGDPTYVQRHVTVVHEDAQNAEVEGIRPGERVAARGTFELLAPAAGGG